MWVALHQAATQPAEHLEFILGLNPLRHDSKIKSVAEQQDRLNDSERPQVIAPTGDERFVNLNAVKRKATEIAKAGVGGAEVIQCHVDTSLLELLHRPQNRL